MRGCSRSRTATIAVLLLAFLAAGSDTRAADEGVLGKSGDKLTTDIKSSGDDDVFTLEVLEGTIVNVKVKAGKKNGLLPTVRIFRPDGSELRDPPYAKKTGTKSPRLKKLPIDAGLTGVWALRIGTTDGETGEYTISFKLKLPKVVKEKKLPLAPGETLRFEFGAWSGAFLTATIRERDKEGAPLTAVRLVDPFGAPIPTAEFLRKKSKLSLKKFPLDRGFGRYAIEVDADGAAGNLLDVLIKVKFPKVKGRKETLPPEAVLEKLSVPVIKQEQQGVAVTLSGQNLLTGGKARISGTGLDLKSFKIESDTTATFVLDAAEDAPYGLRELTFVPPILLGEPQTLTAAIRVNAPDPVITGASTAPIRQGDQGVEIEVYGEHFRPGGTVSLSGTGIKVTKTEVVSPTLARATLDVDLFAPIGLREVTFTQPVEGGGASDSMPDLVTVNYPDPIVTSVTPGVVRQEDTGVTFTVAGQHFRGDGSIDLGPGIAITNVTMVSTSELEVTADVAFDAAYGDRTATYTQAAIGGGASFALDQACVVYAPVPTVTSISPGILKQADSNRLFTVTGQRFRDGGTITISGAGVTVANVTVSSPDSLTVRLSAGEYADIGKRSVTFTQPVAGGGAADTLADALEVHYPDPVISSVNPLGVRQNTTGTVIVTGLYFRAGGTLTTNATGVTIDSWSVVDGSHLSVTMTAAPTAPLVWNSFTFTQAAIGGGASTTLANAWKVYPDILISSVTPDVWRVGAPSFPVSVKGSGFTSGSTVGLGSDFTVHSTTFTDPQNISFVVSVKPDSSIGGHDLTITPTSDNGPPKTFADAVTIVPADPVVLSTSVSSVIRGASNVALTVTGKNFRSGDTLSVNGTGVTFSSVTVANSETITAKVSVTSGATTGARDLFVTHSTADGGRAGRLPKGLTVVSATPTVTGVYPNQIARTGSGGPTRTVDVTISGTNFMTGATAAVSKSGGSGVSVVTGSATVVSTTEMTATLSVTGTATTGAWNVSVTNPGSGGNSGSTGNSAFTVNSETTLTVNKVTPDHGAAHGGDRVTIYGAGFAAGDVVDFGTQRAYATQVVDASTIVTTVPPPAATSTSGPTAVNVTVVSKSSNAAQLVNGYSYAREEVTWFTVKKVVPAQGATGVNRNLRSACVLLTAPIDSATVVYGFTQASQVSWGESGGYGVTGGVHGFGPRKRWLVYSRTSTGNLAIDNTGLYVLNLPTAMKSIGGVNYVVSRVASSTFDQRTFTVSSTATDATNPTLKSITPANYAKNQLTTTWITLVFSEEIDPRTITTTNIVLKKGSSAVGAAIWVDDDLKTVHLAPHTELAANTSYAVSVASGVADLCGNPFVTASYTFTTNNGTDATKPTIDLVTVEDVPGTLDGSGTYVDGSGKGGNAFDLFLPRDGFTLKIDFSDQGGAGIDPTKFSAKCSAAVGSKAANAELASFFTVTHTGAVWTVPSTSLVTAGDNVTFTFQVSDLAGNKSASKTITVDVVDRSASTAGSGSGDLDPFKVRNTWILRFDLDHYTSAFTTQSSPPKQGVTTTVKSNGVNDFDEALRIVGLWTPNMTSAAASTTNGLEVGTNAICRRLVMERIREILRMRFGISADGSRDGDSVNVEFLLPGEQGSLSSLPSYSTSPTAGSNKTFSEISLGGTGGAESNAYQAGTTNGSAYYDDRNAAQEANLNTNGNVGVFVSSMLKREVNGYTTRPFFLTVSSKFVTIHGGTPVGEHASDDDVLSDTFDRSTSTNTTHNKRYDEIMDAIELVSLYVSATVAHEIGHSLGVVADGAPKTGQFGKAHYSNAFTDATSANPNTSGHLSLAGLNNLMATGSSFSLMSRTGTEFQRFGPHVSGYLERRIVYDEGR